MYRFGDCEIDVAARELRRGGAAVHLEPQALDLLLLLLERRDEVVLKADLLDGVWGHRFLSESNLTTRVKEIRRAVGDDGSAQHTIRNVRGRGYRFVAPVVGETASDLIGRTKDLERVVDALASSRLVSLVGPGGVGKTALARECARSGGAARGDGVISVELAPVERPEDVLAAVAREAGVVLDVSRPSATVRAIAGMDALLVLDNCEHLVEPVAVVVDAVLCAPSSAVRFLCTSRERLGLGVEQVVRIEPLSPPDAATLFGRRAAAAAGEWRPGDLDPERVERLLAGLDRLPLTIEMAAARLGSMSFDDLERGLAETGQLLRLTHRSTSPRHRSLQSLVASSVALLDAAGHRVFTDMSVFAGPVTATDVAAVADVTPADSAAVPFVLADLADRSLLVVDARSTPTRYSMLETVRTVAARMAVDDATRAHAVRRRHAEYVARHLREIDRKIRSVEERTGRAELEEQLADVRRAHHWARQHAPTLAAGMSASLNLAAYSTFWSEPVEWSRELLAAHRNTVAGLEGATVLVAGNDASSGRLVAARSALLDAMDTAEAPVRAAALEYMSDVALYCGELDAALRWCADLRTAGLDLGDPHSVAVARVNSALALTYRGDAGAAFEQLTASDLLATSPSDLAWLEYARGEALGAIDDPSAAQTLRAAIELARPVGNPFVASVARIALAARRTRDGALDEARDVFAECLRDHLRHGSFVHAVSTVRNLVELLSAVGEDRGVVLLASATAADEARPSYGTESDGLRLALEAARGRLGDTTFAALRAEGAGVEIDRAVRLAIDVLDGLDRLD